MQNMSQRNTGGGYGFAGPSPYGGSSSEPESSGVLDQIRTYTSKVEDILDTFSEPVKP